MRCVLSSAPSVALTLLLALVGCITEPPSDSNGSMAFVGATIIDGTGRPPMHNGVIIVRDGRILDVGPASAIAVPTGATQTDVSGMTIVPGFIVSHAHLSDVQGLESGHYDEANLLSQLQLYSRYGMTAINSLGGDGTIAVALRNAQDETLNRARVTIAGEVVIGDTVEEAVAIVDKNVHLGVDLIKIRVDDNLGSTAKMTPEIYRAVIERANDKGLAVASHLYYLEDAKDLLNAGTGFLAHSIRDQEVDDEVIELLKEKNVCYCPTLTREVSTFVYESVPAFFQDPFFSKEVDPAILKQLSDPERMRHVANSKAAWEYKKALEQAKVNLKQMADSGVMIAFGTDSGPRARFQGYFEHMEMELMAAAGLTPMQIVKSATGDAARCLGYKEIGTLEVDKWADFIVLSADPLLNIKNMRSIESVWIAGNRVPEKGLSSY